MKTKLYIVIVTLFVLQGCGVFYKEYSSFTPETIQLGMTKEDFIAKFGRPYKQNFFYDDAGDYCEVFFYKETVLVGVSYPEIS